MKPDDESVLSAYFDDQLDADARREVDARLADDPALVARLADFVGVRKAVAGLPRPEAPCRLASAVLARVSAFESERSRRPYYWVATAASLAFGCLLMLRSGLIARPPAPVDVVALPPATPSPAVGDEVDDGRIEAVPDLPEVRPVAVVDRLGPAPDPDGKARRGLVHLLEKPGLGRILVVPDFGDESVAARVEELLRGSARKNPEYGRVAVAPGLAIDREHPEGGEAFVALMDDLERREFLGKLAKDFPRVIHEPATDPGLAGQLADLQGITLGTGPSAAGLKPPPTGAAVALHPAGPPHVEQRSYVGPRHPAVPRFRGDPFNNVGEVVVEPAEPDEAEPAAHGRRARSGWLKQGPHPLSSGCQARGGARAGVKADECGMRTRVRKQKGNAKNAPLTIPGRRSSGWPGHEDLAPATRRRLPTKPSRPSTLCLLLFAFRSLLSALRPGQSPGACWPASRIGARTVESCGGPPRRRARCRRGVE